jgi:outer membrane immunogenic protein
MRRVFLAAMMFGAVSVAHAADMPDLPVLRGGFSQPVRSTWDGWYVGGQASYQSADMDFSKSITALASFIFRNSVLSAPTSSWSVLGPAHAQGSGFGGFVGRDWQFEDVVLGVEANYTYMNGLSASTANQIARDISNPTGTNPPAGHTYTYSTTVEGGAGVVVKDVTTFRGRAGWAAGDFMPYFFAGLAVGRMVPSRFVTTTVYLTDQWTDITGNPQQVGPTIIPTVSQNVSESRQSFVPGWTAGVGLEYRVVGGLFLRGEYEYTSFSSVKDTFVQLNAVRGGIGYKF